LLLSGSLLEAPPDAGVMLTGAVCITMHPATAQTPSSSNLAGGPNATHGGKAARRSFLRACGSGRACRARLDPFELGDVALRSAL
jgi:hypothetical protein